jgi:hypothetical protein
MERGDENSTVCVCGQPPIFRCVNCTPRQVFCKDCAIVHIANNPDDDVVGYYHKASNGVGTLCDVCKKCKAVKLAVLSDRAQKVCKICRLNFPNTISLELKFEGLVKNADDIPIYYKRMTSVEKALNEIELARDAKDSIKALQTVKEQLHEAIEKEYLAKVAEITQANERVTEYYEALANEVREEGFKPDIDIERPGGRLVASFFSPSVTFNMPKQKITLPDMEKMRKKATKGISSFIVESINKKSYYVYLFYPGKNTLIRINLETLTKNEFAFDKTWTFEASWYEMESGDLLFCGGNGIDNSEVMLVKINPQAIQILEHFTGRSGHGMIEAKREIFVFGGNRGNISEKYSLLTEKWILLSPLPKKITRVSVALSPDKNIIICGSDLDTCLRYDIEDDSYDYIGKLLEGCAPKNKIIFFYEDLLVCLAGDKMFTWKFRSDAGWTTYPIADRDWWTYSNPVVHDGCAYFVKYFVRNLWRVDLRTMTMREYPLNEIPEA